MSTQESSERTMGGSSFLMMAGVGAVAVIALLVSTVAFGISVFGTESDAVASGAGGGGTTTVDVMLMEFSVTPAVIDVPAGDKIAALAVAPNPTVAARLKTHGEVISRLARLTGIANATAAPKGAVEIVHEGAAFALPLTGAIDIEGAKKRLAKEVEKCAKEIEGIDKKFAVPSFIERAPPEIVEESKERRLEADARRLKLAAALKNLSA